MMKRFINTNKLWFRLFSAILLGISTASCSLMDTDTSECPAGLYVNFVYDYNTQRADMFKDHVGYVTVYVFDESDRLVMQRSAGNYGADAPLATYGYQMHFTPEELPVGTYRLVALAMQKDWGEALATSGAKYRRTELKKGDSKSALQVTLDNTAATAEDYASTVSNAAPLDTLWYGTTGAPGQASFTTSTVTLNATGATYSTINLMRDTKTLNITIRDIDHPNTTPAEKFGITITADNTLLDSDNELVDNGRTLYTPYAQWTTQYPETGDAEETTAHYDINFNRLMYNNSMSYLNTSDSGAAILKLWNKENGALIGEFNLAYLLADGRNAFETVNYTAQGYLDREYNYNLDFVLKGDLWKYINISVGILGWAHRVENVQL
jgi:hypothetical protein